MSVRGRSVHPKLSEAAHNELMKLSVLRGVTAQSICEDILHRSLLGEGYRLNLAIDVNSRLVKAGQRG